MSLSTGWRLVGILGSVLVFAAVSKWVLQTRKRRSLKERLRNGLREDVLVDESGARPKALDCFTLAKLYDEPGAVNVPWAPASLTTEEEMLYNEQLARNFAFLGADGMQKLRESFVIVLGCGGVGSHAAHLLARSGVGKLRLIDFDQVTLSSLNRAPLATRADVGLPKVVSLASHLRAITPWVTIEPVIEVFVRDKADILFTGRPTLVLECIDNIDAKVDALAYCHAHGLAVLSAMGAGGKWDPTKLAVSDIAHTTEDALARAVRRRLKQVGITKGITCVYSCEKPNGIGLLPLPDAKAEESVEEFAVLPDFRVRIMPVLGTLPALFGMTLATVAIRDLTRACSVQNQPTSSYPTLAPPSPYSMKKQSSEYYARLLRDLVARERRLYPGQTPATGAFPISSDQIKVIMEDIWHFESATQKFELVPAALQEAKSTKADTRVKFPASLEEYAALTYHPNREKFHLVRWNPDLPLSVNNVVPLGPREATYHEQYVAKRSDDALSHLRQCPFYTPEWVDAVNNFLSSLYLA